MSSYTFTEKKKRKKNGGGETTSHQNTLAKQQLLWEHGPKIFRHAQPRVKRKHEELNFLLTKTLSEHGTYLRTLYFDWKSIKDDEVALSGYFGTNILSSLLSREITPWP